MFWFVTKLFFYVYIGKMNINFEEGPMYNVGLTVYEQVYQIFPTYDEILKINLPWYSSFPSIGVEFAFKFLFLFSWTKNRFREPPIVFPQYSVKIIHFICFKGAAVFNFFCLHSLRKYETKIDKILTLSSGTLKGKSRIIDSIFNYYWMISF